MSVVFHIGYSKFPGVQDYNDEIYTSLDKAKELVERTVNKPIKWSLVHDSGYPVWCGEYKNSALSFYAWIKPVVLNTPEYEQRIKLQHEKWNKPKLFK